MRVFPLLVLLSASACTSEPLDTAAPVIDMHLHGLPVDVFGQVGLVEIFIGAEAPTTNQSMIAETIAALDAHNVTRAFLSGPLEGMPQWLEANPERFIASAFLGHDRQIASPDFGPPISVEQLREAYETGWLQGMGEVVSQYAGIAPNDPSLTPYFALASEFDVPVLIHTAGLGAPSEGFRSALGNPLLLEEVVTRFPTLRLYVENAGYPFLSEIVALMLQYPQVYADLSTVLRIVPEAEFHEYLRGLMRAGLGKRLMFGSDQGIWPDAIGYGIRAIQSVPFLTTEEKRDILYNNAARFLRIEDTPSGE